jgi:iron complex outermembrane receptor protein
MKRTAFRACRGRFALAPLTGITLGLAALIAVASPQSVADITELGLEDLMKLEITSVSRRTQSVSEAASAVYVITSEDIRRTGVTSLPDALRLAPGVHVMQMDGSKWAISIRGFTGRFSNKLLVMIDGRSVYSPIFGGVYWEANDVLLEDIERIEVIRGPGATLWGSNAVNGVINIISKHTRETQGALVASGGGNQEGGFGSARVGGEAGSRLHYRFSSKYNSRSGLLLPSGARANDNLWKMQGGFRIDWEPSERDEVLFSGDAYQGDAGERFRVPLVEPPFQRQLSYRNSFSGNNVLGRWTRKHSERSLTQVQFYFDHIARDNLLERDTTYSVADAEIQHELDLSRSRLVFGLGYRASHDTGSPDWFAHFEPSRRTLHRVNTFVQDEIAISPDRLFLTVGSKFENNTLSGWGVQPSASLLWKASEKDTVWLSASHSDRSLSRVDRNLSTLAFAAPGPQDSLVMGRILGGDDVEPEHLRAFEAGYRFRPKPRLSFDLAAFHNTYEGLIDSIEQPPRFLGGQPPTILIPFVFTNATEDEALYGAELAVSWNPVEAASLRTSYSFLRGGRETATTVLDPAHVLQIRWYWNLPGRLEWDSSYAFTDRHSFLPAYHRVDTRLGWRPSPRWELSVVGQHLLDNHHIESPALFAVPTEVGRSVYGKIAWTFQNRQ